MYLKFGFGRATQDAGIEIRRGAMTRSQAINLVKLYDYQYPSDFLKDYLKYYQMREKDFVKAIDKWVNKQLLSKQKMAGSRDFKSNKMFKVGIINYGMGNIRSIQNILLYLGIKSEVISSAEKIANKTHLILPGVGSFMAAMTNLEK